MKHYTYFNFYENLEIEEKVSLVKEAGFDGVFLFYSEHLDEEVGAIRKANLDIETLHLPFKNCNHLWLDTIEARKYLDLIKEGINGAFKHNIKTVVFHLSSKDNPPAFNELGLNRLRDLLNLCESLDINFALENLRRLDYLDYVLDNLKSERLKFCFDSGHANAFTKNIETFEFEKYSDKLICVHLHDNDGTFDSHLIPFTGNINWEKLANNFKAINYQNSLTSEAIFKGDNIDVLSELKKVKSALEKINSYMS